jgi:hypothetical protein
MARPEENKNTCRERFKGNVGLHTSTLQSHRQSDTNRSHNKNTHTTHTEIISCDNKILCKEEEHKYTKLVLQRGVCERERCFAPKEKCGSRSARGCALRTNLQNKTQWGIRKRKEWKGRNEGREREEEHEEEEKDTFEIFFLQGGPFYFLFWIANYFLKETKE